MKSPSGPSDCRLHPPEPAPPEDRSYWIRSTWHADTHHLAPLTGEERAEIAIIGGGLTGLWTAWRLIELDPEADVIILEGDFCGSGASGRNGGQVHTWFGDLDALRVVAGDDEARRLARATRDAITELKQLQDDGTLEMGLRLDGFINASVCPTHDGDWEGIVRDVEAGGDTPYELLDGPTARKLTGTATSRGGVREPFSGTMDPFRLVQSMRDRLVERGVRIYEQSPVTELHTGSPATLRTPSGVASADRALVASNAWAGSIPQINRHMYAVDAGVVATEPIPELLDELGIVDGRAISDSQMQVLYLQRTVDDRLLIGQGSGWPVYGARIGARSNRNERLTADVTAELHRMYPSLRDAGIDYDWAGTIDISATHLPVIDHLEGASHVMFCVGWTGTALAQIPVVARMLASKLLRVDDEWSRSPFADQRGHHIAIAPEPFRFLGAHIVRRAVTRRVRREREDKPVGRGTRALIALMPRYRDPVDAGGPRKTTSGR